MRTRPLTRPAHRTQSRSAAAAAACEVRAPPRPRRAPRQRQLTCLCAHRGIWLRLYSRYGALTPLRQVCASPYAGVEELPELQKPPPPPRDAAAVERASRQLALEQQRVLRAAIARRNQRTPLPGDEELLQARAPSQLA